MLEKSQCGSRQKHSSETALLRVFSDLMMSSDVGECCVLVLLDLSADFDTVDHSVLTGRLRQWVGVSGGEPVQGTPNLSDRSFSLPLGPYMCETAALSCGMSCPYIICFVYCLGHIL